VKDKANGEGEAPVADEAHCPDALCDDAALGPAEHPRGHGTGADAHAKQEGPEPNPPDRLVLQDDNAGGPDFALPAPGLPDRASFSGEPCIAPADVPDGEPAVEAALAWQPEVEPDPEPATDAELIGADHAAPAQSIGLDSPIDAVAETPDVGPALADPHDHPCADEPPGAPIAVNEPVAEEEPARHQPRAEQVRSDPPWSQDPTVPMVEARGEAPWPEQAPAELPTIDQPALVEPAPDASQAQQTATEATRVAHVAAAHLATSPTLEMPIEAPWPEQVPGEEPTPDAPAAEASTEGPAEQPLRDRIPSVLPVELEAIKAPLDVPVFEAPPRPPEAAQPTIAAPTHAGDAGLAAASGATAATAVAWRADAIDAAAPSRPLPADITPLLRRAFRLAVLTLGSLACLVLVLIVLYRWVNPPASTLMLGQWLTGTRIDQRWLPLSRISPYLQRAVITSEDGRFCRHHGVDWGEIEEAIERARDGVPRGGSTISMQVVKNLFLWPSKSYVRKALEFPLTFAIELAWSKPRILEIYLNIAEWGPGVFGAEAAARYHFGKSASALTPSQAALLAVSLPNPIERRAGAPGPGMLRLATTIHARMMASPGNANCVQTRR